MERVELVKGETKIYVVSEFVEHFKELGFKPPKATPRARAKVADANED